MSDSNYDPGRKDYYEETAAEFAETARRAKSEWSEENYEENTLGALIGYIGIAFAILSMFWLPTTMAIIAMFMGVFAYMQTAKGLGITAITISGISLFIQYFWT